MPVLGCRGKAICHVTCDARVLVGDFEAGRETGREVRQKRIVAKTNLILFGDAGTTWLVRIVVLVYLKGFLTRLKLSGRTPGEEVLAQCAREVYPDDPNIVQLVEPVWQVGNPSRFQKSMLSLKRVQGRTRLSGQGEFDGANKSKPTDGNWVTFKALRQQLALFKAFSWRFSSCGGNAFVKLSVTSFISNCVWDGDSDLRAWVISLMSRNLPKKLNNSKGIVWS